MADSVLQIPELSLVVLVGPSGAGKSTFARRHFKATEILSSDTARGWVRDDENSMEATTDAFDTLRFIAGKRLAAGLLTVIDATSLQKEARAPWLRLAKEHHVLPVAIVLNVDEKTCKARNAARPERAMGAHVFRQHASQLRQSLPRLRDEGFRQVFALHGPEAVDGATLERRRLWTNRKDESGPFDIVGDIHGCYEETVALLTKLGYEFTPDAAPGEAPTVRHPGGRRVIFLGDLVDRGPGIVPVLKLALRMCAEGAAICIPGNHENKLVRHLRGRNVKLTHGLQETVDQLAGESNAFRAALADWLDSLVSHFVLDGGRLVVAHAGMKESLQGRASGRVRDFSLYGETTGETDEYGLPVRHNWAAEYRGKATVVYGHTPVPDAEWLNNTICVDTGCVYGGKLTALRYPERELVSVAAAREYFTPAKPLRPAAADGLTAQQASDTLLDFADVSGKRIITTRLQHNVTVREENAAAALEVMSRFAVDPRWLLYLPPTMSPSETTAEPGLLEHPREALDYYRSRGVAQAVCQEKHMGSRAVVVVCRDETVARDRFGVDDGSAGIVYSRTGRRFFDDPALEGDLLRRVREAAEKTGFWDEFKTGWLALDCELMPWSVKAQALLEQQYAAVGAAARAADEATLAALARASVRLPEAAAAHAGAVARAKRHDDYNAAWARYCWPVKSPADLRLAPFHLLATEGAVHADRDHLWHMERLASLCAGDDGALQATRHRVVDLADPASLAAAIEWWESLTAAGGEGMVVKSREFVAYGKKGLLQPAIKCRGREYLRIIYGPEYDRPEHLERLRQRGLSSKRGLALREFALGVEGLERFVRKTPLRNVHECVFAVLALESEPVDPRL